LAFAGVAMVFFSAAWALLIPLVRHFGPRFLGGSAAVEAGTSLPPVVWCGFWSVVFLVLGFGVIFCKRWARVLTQSVGWFWLVSGVTGLAALWFFYPEVTEMVRPLSGGAGGPGAEVAMVWLVGVVGVLFVLVPGLMVVYFTAPSVRATCRAFDPVERWTDSRPVGALVAAWALVALALWAAWLSWSGAAFPAFGDPLEGLRGSQVWAGLAGGFALLALASFNPRPWVWVVTMLGLGAAAAAVALPSFRAVVEGGFAPPAGTADKVVVATAAFWLLVLLGFLALAGCYFRGRRGAGAPAAGDDRR
jgi:hypothetical protein